MVGIRVKGLVAQEAVTALAGRRQVGLGGQGLGGDTLKWVWWSRCPQSTGGSELVSNGTLCAIK